MVTRFNNSFFVNQEVIDIYGGLSIYINKFVNNINTSDNTVLLNLFNEVNTELKTRGLPTPTVKSF